MRSFHARGVASALVLAGLASVAAAQDVGIPSLLPVLPAGQPAYPVTPAAATDVLWSTQDVSPAPVQTDDLPSPAAMPAESVVSPDFEQAMYGDCGAGDCQTDCCNNFYVYGSTLWMTREKRGGFVTSIDSVTFSPELFFCSPGFGDQWFGGVEVGAGWCLSDGCGGCGTTAVEITYWGLYPDTHTIEASGPLDSLIDFSDLDYNGAGLDTLYNGAAAHRLSFHYEIHSAEVNLVGNCSQGGPFGCSRMCTCSHAGCCRSRWGFGWLAGLRYIDYGENFLFSTDFDDTIFDDDATQANYIVNLDNDLLGFQLGGGINYCVTQNLSAYVIGKVGVYNNHVTQDQRITGSAGPVTINNGPFTGQEFGVRDQTDVLAMVGQFDLGARWNLNRSWSVDFGYRVVALSGVAIAEDNVQQGNFQNLDGIADTQTQGSVLLHGGYAGLTYAW